MVAPRSHAKTVALRLALLVALVPGLAGCGGRIEGALTPVANAAGVGSEVSLLVATTREPAAIDADLFTGERGLGLRFADITVSIPPEGARAVGEVKWPTSTPGDPSREFVVVDAKRLDLPQAVETFSRRLKATRGRRVLVFVHGYNNRFDDAVFRLAQIVHDSNASVMPVLFTWPSRAKLLAYGYDRESANYSRTALEMVLKTLADNPEVAQVDILAHSMGNWLTMEALRQMAIRDGRIAPKIETVMLAAPDIDIDVFRGQMIDIGPTRPQMVLFVSGDDRALAVSKRVWQSSARLGAIDPTKEPFKSRIEASGLTVIDLTKIKAGDSLNHGKFAESPEVVQLIGTRLMDGQTLTDARASVGERIIQLSTDVAATAGTAVGVAVSAPAAIVDPDTRRAIGDTLGTTAPPAQ